MTGARRKRLAMTLAAGLAFGLTAACPMAQAQTAAETSRVVAALRQNGCSADEGDMDRLLPGLNMSQSKAKAILQAMMKSGGLALHDRRVTLADQLCKGKAASSSIDTALAAKLVNSERAQRRYIEALFAANGCQLSYAQWQIHLDHTFPSAAAENDVAKTRLRLEALPALMVQEGVLKQGDDPQIMRSLGKGCR